MELSEIRARIDAVDDQLLDLFLKRMALSEEVAAYKHEHKLPILNKAREREILAKVAQRAGDKERYAYHLYSTLFELARSRQAELISALGVEYSLVCFFDLDTGEGRALRLGECKNNILASIFTGRLSLEESVGRYIAAGVYEEDREVLRQAVSREHLKEVLADDPICSVNYRTTCCGELRYFQMKAARVGEWSQSCGIVLGFRSIDEETRSDREKNAILEDALAQANRASSAKSAFLSNMSHDIRTPMNAIIGFTTLAITHIDRQEQVAGYLKKIMTSGNHLLSLINDVLDMSRIESGKIYLDTGFGLSVGADGVDSRTAFQVNVVGLDAMGFMNFIPEVKTGLEDSEEWIQ